MNAAIRAQRASVIDGPTFILPASLTQPKATRPAAPTALYRGAAAVPSPDDQPGKQFGTVNPPTLAQHKVDDRGAGVTSRRLAEHAAAVLADVPAVDVDDDMDVPSMLLEIGAAIQAADVLPQVKDEMCREVRRLAGDAVAAQQMARIQQILDANVLPAELRVSTVIASFLCPAWCDDCLPDEVGNSPTHGTLIGVAYGETAEGEPVEYEVRVERHDWKGRPGKAVVVADDRRIEFDPECAAQVADLYTRAALLATRDRAEVGLS